MDFLLAEFIYFSAQTGLCIISFSSIIVLAAEVKTCWVKVMLWVFWLLFNISLSIAIADAFIFFFIFLALQSILALFGVFCIVRQISPKKARNSVMIGLMGVVLLASLMTLALSPLTHPMPWLYPIY